MHDRADLARDLGATLREARRRLGLSQQELADLAGVSVRFVGSLEGGKATVQLDRLLAVADTLGLRVQLRGA